MHRSRPLSVKQYRRSHSDFNFPANHLHSEHIEQDPGVQRECEHERKGQRHCPIKDDHRDNVDMRVVEPGQRRDEKLRNLRNQHQHHQKKEEYHFRPVTTNTSSRCERSTAGVSCACPSNSRTRKVFTTPMSKPEGKTPPTPEV